MGIVFNLLIIMEHHNVEVSCKRAKKSKSEPSTPITSLESSDQQKPAENSN